MRTCQRVVADTGLSALVLTVAVSEKTPTLQPVADAPGSGPATARTSSEAGSATNDGTARLPGGLGTAAGVVGITAGGLDRTRSRS
jgi:hypothetical protein